MGVPSRCTIVRTVQQVDQHMLQRSSADRIDTKTQKKEKRMHSVSVNLPNRP
jgi:hypothetical protein